MICLSATRLLPFLAALLVVLSSCPLSVQAQKSSAAHSDLGEMMKELVDIHLLEHDQSQMAIWLPYELFVAAASADNNMTRQQAQNDCAFIKPFILVIIQADRDAPDGTSIYDTEKSIRSRAFIRMPDGSLQAPLESVPSEVAEAANGMKKDLASEGDAAGKSMYVLVYSAKDKNGRPIINAAAKGKLTIVLKSAPNFAAGTFVWRTPLETIVPPSVCFHCHDQISGKWRYCPWCGQQVRNSPPPAISEKPDARAGLKH